MVEPTSLVLLHEAYGDTAAAEPARYAEGPGASKLILVNGSANNLCLSRPLEQGRGLEKRAQHPQGVAFIAVRQSPDSSNAAQK